MKKDVILVIDTLYRMDKHHKINQNEMQSYT